jgi:hypothetical protein
VWTIVQISHSVMIATFLYYSIILLGSTKNCIYLFQLSTLVKLSSVTLLLICAPSHAGTLTSLSGFTKVSMPPVIINFSDLLSRPYRSLVEISALYYHFFVGSFEISLSLILLRIRLVIKFILRNGLKYFTPVACK